MNRNITRIVVILTTLLFCSLTLALASSGKNRYALVIGNGDYQAMTKLANPVNDATDIGAELIEFGFHVNLLTNASLGEMAKSVDDFVTTITQNKDVEAALFYYAGHGVQYNGSNYLIPVNTDIRASYELLDKALSMDSVARGLEGTSSEFNLIILDACRDNPFSVTRGGDRGLSAMTTSKQGSMMVFATSPGDVAQDGLGRNSPFTEALLKAMQIPGMEIRPLIFEVQRMVRDGTDGRQVPWLNTSYTGEFYFQTVEEQLARSQKQLSGLQAEIALLEQEITQRETAIQATKNIEERRRLEAEQIISKALEAAKQLEAQRILEIEQLAQAILDSDLAQDVLKHEMENRLASQEVNLRQYASTRRDELDALRRAQAVGTMSLLDYLETIAQYNRSIDEIRDRYNQMIKEALADLDALHATKVSSFKARNPRDPWESVLEHVERIKDDLAELDRENYSAKVEQRMQFEALLEEELAPLYSLLTSICSELDGMLFEVPMENIQISVSDFDVEEKKFPMNIRVDDELGVFSFPFSFDIVSHDRETLKNEYYRFYSADQSGALVGRVAYRVFRSGDNLWIVLLEHLEVLNLLEEDAVLATLWQPDELRMAPPVTSFAVNDTVRELFYPSNQYNFLLSGLPKESIITIDGVQHKVSDGGVFKSSIKNYGNKTLQISSPWLYETILRKYWLSATTRNSFIHADVSSIGLPIGLLSILRPDLELSVVSTTNKELEIPLETSPSGYVAKLLPGEYTVQAKLPDDLKFTFSTNVEIIREERTLLDPGPLKLSLERRLELEILELEKLKKEQAVPKKGKITGSAFLGVATACVAGSIMSYVFYNNAVQNYNNATLTTDLIKYRQDAKIWSSLFTAGVVTGISGVVGGGTVLGLNISKSKNINQRVSEQEKVISSLKTQIAAQRAKESVSSAFNRLGEETISLASWQPNFKDDVTLWFSLDGGNMREPIEQSVTSGSAIGPLPIPTKSGYLFDGWWTNLGSRGIQVDSTTLIPRGDSFVLYAKWVENQ